MELIIGIDSPLNMMPVEVPLNNEPALLGMDIGEVFLN